MACHYEFRLQLMPTDPTYNKCVGDPGTPRWAHSKDHHRCKICSALNTPQEVQLPKRLAQGAFKKYNWGTSAPQTSSENSREVSQLPYKEFFLKCTAFWEFFFFNQAYQKKKSPSVIKKIIPYAWTVFSNTQQFHLRENIYNRLNIQNKNVTVRTKSFSRNDPFGIKPALGKWESPKHDYCQSSSI